MTEIKMLNQFHNVSRNFKFWTAFFGVFTFCAFFLLSGCGQKDTLDEARIYSQRAQNLYEKAESRYKDLIREKKDLNQVHFELGLLYYNQGKFSQACEEFLNTNEPGAEEYLALCYYKLSKFTQALNLFKQIEERLIPRLQYYYGLTCEELNLYPQAVEIYENIEDEFYKKEARRRIQFINSISSLEGLFSAETQEIIASSPRPETYPEAGAVVLFCNEEIEITEDWQAEFHEHFMIKILNERGKEDFAEIVIGYDSTDEEVELEYARTIQPDGTVTSVGARHIRDVSKYLNFPLYSNARCRIISFPEVSVGVIIEYKYKLIRHELINMKDFVLFYSPREKQPIMKAELKIKIPKDYPFHYRTLNEEYNTFGAQLQPRIKESEDYKEYYWQFADIPQIIPESNMPSYAKINPLICVSTFDSWQEIYHWWWDLALGKMASDEAIRKKVKDLTKDEEGRLEKIKAIYNFCAQEIRYVAVEYGRAGFEPHAASEIFFNKYGDCKDQTILLITMLKELGEVAHPVLIGTDDYLNLEEDFPSLYFNHCIAGLELDGDLIFLDPTASTCSFGDLPTDDQERRVFVFGAKGHYQIAEIPQFEPEHNRMQSFLKIHIAPDETIKAEKRVSTFGFYDQGQRFWLKYSPPDSIKEMLSQSIQFLSKAKLTEYEIKNVDNLNVPLVLDYSFAGTDYWQRAGKLRILPQLVQLDTSSVARQIRRWPIDLGPPYIKEQELEIVLPKGTKILYLPTQTEEECPWFKLVVQYRTEAAPGQDSSSIYFKQITELKKKEVAAAQYRQFKDFLEQLSSQIKERIVLEYEAQE
ncbi:MAG: DUF3857 domain-containing protein [Candidatus Omnitrophica bacterium]|nr:DUF3857 domain-containing protein [Candidatus Omnitrophota bacterium]